MGVFDAIAINQPDKVFTGNVELQSGFVSKDTSGASECTLAIARQQQTMSGASVTYSNLIPAGSIVLGVSIHVDTAVTGATSINVGDGSTQTRWGSAIAVALDTVSDLRNSSDSSPPIFTSAQSVVLTAVGSNFTGGQVTVEVHYISVLAS